jgi:hypothetical protein
MTTPPTDPRLRRLYEAAKRRAFIRRRMEMLATVRKALGAGKGKK